MFNQLTQVFTTGAWWGDAAYVATLYLLAWVVHRLARWIARALVRLRCLTRNQPQLRPERCKTVQSVIASGISYSAFAAATVASLARFVRLDTLVWVVGLFSAAFGLGARPLISDVLTGIGLIFEDTFAVGEKVEILGVQGVVEVVNLRTTCMRAPTGELYVVPNGEIRVVRNFSRGRFSTAKLKLKIASADLGSALPLLEELGKEAVAMLPNLLEPWQVISESGTIGQETELTLLAKARFGQAAEMCPRLLALVQERMSEAGVTLAS